MDEQQANDVCRIRRLEDLEEIRRLQALYCRYSDRGFANAGTDPEALAQLFVADGVWEVEGGDVRGRAAIAARLRRFGPFGFHLTVNGDVVVDGDEAHARWHALVPATSLDDRAVWTAGVYDTELARTADGWRFVRVSFSAAFRAPYDEGWAGAGD
jgi:hypothetical protein